MVFSSIEFLLCFLPIFILLYWITPDKFKNVTLVVCSLAFYAYGELQYFVLLILSLYGNFFAGLYLGKESKYYRYGADRRADRPGERSRKRVVLALAVAVNVGVLLFFKVNHGKLGLPLGISFYTFQMLSYLIDVSGDDPLREISASDGGVHYHVSQAALRSHHGLWDH